MMHSQSQSHTKKHKQSTLQEDCDWDWNCPCQRKFPIDPVWHYENTTQEHSWHRVENTGRIHTHEYIQKEKTNIKLTYELTLRGKNAMSAVSFASNCCVLWTCNDWFLVSVINSTYMTWFVIKPARKICKPNTNPEEMSTQTTEQRDHKPTGK